MNQVTSYAPNQQAESTGSIASVLRELVAAMPIVVLVKAMRVAFKSN